MDGRQHMKNVPRQRIISQRMSQLKLMIPCKKVLMTDIISPCTLWTLDLMLFIAIGLFVWVAITFKQSRDNETPFIIMRTFPFAYKVWSTSNERFTLLYWYNYSIVDVRGDPWKYIRPKNCHLYLVYHSFAVRCWMVSISSVPGDKKVPGSCKYHIKNIYLPFTKLKNIYANVFPVLQTLFILIWL